MQTMPLQAQTLNVAPALLTEAEAARYIGFSREFLRQSRSHGRRDGRTPGPAYVRFGRTIRYRLVDLDEWALRHRREVR